MPPKAKKRKAYKPRKQPDPPIVPKDGMQVMADLSSRTYIYAFIEAEKTVTGKLEAWELLAETDDTVYKALQSRLDNVLDLRFGDRLVLVFNLGNDKDSTGFIKRIA